MQNYKEINGNDYVKDSRTTINETMRSIQSMNSGTVFPTTNLFEGMKCYRTDLKKTYTLTDVENNTWVEDAHAELADEATHAASATRLQTPSALNLSGAVTADAANFDGTADATINVKTLDASKLKGTTSVSTTGNAATATKLAAARTIALSGNASGSTTFDGSGNATINATVNESAHAATATKVVTNAASGASANIAEATMGGSDFARIRVSGASDVNELALETADNGDEAIVARQYTGDFKDVARTASILDANGNTSFPGTVVAPKFTGALNGNAATASKLLTPRTISLTGKAAGSASFDGSSNASINVTSVNADTASKLSTARKINITGNATGVASFDGSGDVNISVTVNESKHAAAATTVNATAPNGGAADLAFGTMAVNDYARIRVYGKNDNGALEIATADAGTEPIYARQYGGSCDWPNGRPGVVVNEAAILDSNGNTKFPKNVTAASFTGPLKGNADTASKLNTVGGGATTFNWVGKADQPNWLWGGNNSAPTEQYVYNPSNFHVASANTATSATTAGNVSNKIYYSSDSPSVATDKLFTVKQAHAGDDNVPNNGLVIQSGPTGANYNGKLYITDNGGDGVWVGGVAAGKEVGWKRLVENWGSWNINAATATNATKATTAAACTGNSATASRLATARSIALTGNATGSATFDGSGNISISTNVNTASNADKLDNYHASDILNRITAANTGGIVAASLTANGYVKFANGLILQWGTRTEPKVDDWVWVTTTFPITFASACFSVTCCDELTSTYDGDVESFVRNIKTNSVDIRYRSDHLGRNLRWLALGV